MSGDYLCVADKDQYELSIRDRNESSNKPDKPVSVNIPLLKLSKVPATRCSRQHRQSPPCLEHLFDLQRGYRIMWKTQFPQVWRFLQHYDPGDYPIQCLMRKRFCLSTYLKQMEVWSIAYDVANRTRRKKQR